MFNFKVSVTKCNRTAYLITFHLAFCCLGIWNMNGKEVNVLANGEFMLVIKSNLQAYLSRQEQCKTAKHLLPHLVIDGCCTNQIVLIRSGYSDQSECKRRARMLVQSGPSWPAHASCTTSQWIINLSASISALESIPNTKAKCPPCSEAALLRVCGYFNKN